MTHRLLLPITAAALVLLLVATAVAAHDYDTDHVPALRCESQFNKTQQCAIEGPMRLARQLSVTRCVENQNWGQRRRMLWGSLTAAAPSSSPTSTVAGPGAVVIATTRANAWSASRTRRRTRNAASACATKCAWSSRSR